MLNKLKFIPTFLCILAIFCTPLLCLESAAESVYLIDTTDVTDVFSVADSAGGFFSAGPYLTPESSSSMSFDSANAYGMSGTYFRAYYTSGSKSYKSGFIQFKSNISSQYSIDDSKMYVVQLSLILRSSWSGFGSGYDYLMLSYIDSLESLNLRFSENSTLSVKPNEVGVTSDSSDVFCYADFDFTCYGSYLNSANWYICCNSTTKNYYPGIAFRLSGSTPFRVREYTEADGIADIGSDIAQPDFGSTNGKLNDTTAQMDSFDDEYSVNADDVNNAFGSIDSFFGNDYNAGANLVQVWFDRFTSDNNVMLLFFSSVLCIGLACFAIGRGFK